MEFWDLYDANRIPLRQTHVRGTALPEGAYHIVVSIWTLNQKGELLTTLRSPEKESEPNLWENTAGSVIAGEESRTGAARELWEETGIRVDPAALTLLGTFREPSAFIDCYLARSNAAEKELVLLAGETVNAAWRSIPDFERLITAGNVAVSVMQRYAFVKEQLKNCAEAMR